MLSDYQIEAIAKEVAARQALVAPGDMSRYLALSNAKDEVIFVFVHPLKGSVRLVEEKAREGWTPVPGADARDELYWARRERGI